MSGQPTRAGWGLPAPNAWRQWGAFVRRPSLPDKADLSFGRGLKTLFPLFGLDLLLMGVLLGAVGAAIALGFEMPEHLMGEMDLRPQLVALFVMGMPIVEETLFRGWLSGRLGHLLGTLLVAPAFVAFLIAFGPRPAGAPAPELATLVSVAAGFAAAAAIAVYLCRRRSAARWFQRAFVFFYWISALIFALVHLTNFAAVSPAMLPLVLPQFVLATILGYLRVTHGLWSSVLLHMLHNSVFMALVLAGSGAS